MADKTDRHEMEELYRAWDGKVAKKKEAVVSQARQKPRDHLTLMP